MLADTKLAAVRPIHYPAAVAWAPTGLVRAHRELSSQQKMQMATRCGNDVVCQRGTPRNSPWPGAKLGEALLTCSHSSPVPTQGWQALTGVALFRYISYKGRT